ncbi:MAG TPA: ABC transporter permease [Ktedonobacterales bacterium]
MKLLRSTLRRLDIWDILLVILLIAILALGSVQAPYFLNPTSFSLMFSNFSEKSIMILAMMLIIIVGEIDLSVASVLGLSSAILGFLFAAGWPLWLALFVALLSGGVAGLFNGLLVTRVGLPSLVVTLGTLALFRGAAYIVLGDRGISNFPDAFTQFGYGSIPGTLIPWTFLVFAALAAVVALVLHGSWVGRQLYAIGNNREAARFAGIPVARIKLLLFVVSGLVAALAGIIFTARFSSARADNAVGFELDVITVVLLGGVNIFGGRGTLLGVLLALGTVGALRSALGLADYPDQVQSIIVGVLLIVSTLGPNLVRRVQDAIVRRRVAPKQTVLQRSTP